MGQHLVALADAPHRPPPDPRGAISPIVHTPDVQLLIYGTVLPWSNDKRDDSAAGMWQVRYRQIERQSRNWGALRRNYPRVPLVVAGDFKQDRDGSGWFSTHHGRQLLTDALDTAGLTCVTAEDVVATGKLRDSHLVDHIGISRDWTHHLDVDLHCYDKTDTDGARLSEHPTIAIDLRPTRPAA